MATTFDGDTLTITLGTPTDGVLNLDVQDDLYSDWKEWMVTSDNIKYPPAFRTVGGDSLTTNVDAGAYYFLRNDYGWRIKPSEYDQTIYVIGNLVAQDSALPLAVPTTGGYTVLMLGLQAVTQGIDNLCDTVFTDSRALTVQKFLGLK